MFHRNGRLAKTRDNLDVLSVLKKKKRKGEVARLTRNNFQLHGGNFILKITVTFCSLRTYRHFIYLLEFGELKSINEKIFCTEKNIVELAEFNSLKFN